MGQVQYCVMPSTTVLGGPVELNAAALKRAAILIGIGATIAGTGMLIGGWSVAQSGRKWAKELERSPLDIAASHWPRVKAAASAGYERWSSTQPRPVSRRAS